MRHTLRQRRAAVTPSASSSSRACGIRPLVCGWAGRRRVPQMRGGTRPLIINPAVASQPPCAALPSAESGPPENALPHMRDCARQAAGHASTSRELRQSLRLIPRGGSAGPLSRRRGIALRLALFRVHLVALGPARKARLSHCKQARRFFL